MGDAEADGEMEDEDDQGHDPAAAASAALSHNEHVDLNTAANILANGGASSSAATGVMGLQDQTHGLPTHQPPAPMGNPQQQQQQLSDHGGPAHNMDPSFVKATEEMARESGYGSLNVDSGLAKRLAREPGLRIAQQRRPEQQLNLARRSNVEALYAHIAGELAPTSCKNCHKGHGPWTSCVVVDGQMCGSCANCWFNASGARCSFHGTNPYRNCPPSPLPYLQPAAN
jgi:3-dehydrosphinganine reductase